MRCECVQVLLRRIDGATAEAEIAAAAALADRVARERGRLAGALQIATGAGDARDARPLPERARRCIAPGRPAVTPSSPASGTLGLDAPPARSRPRGSTSRSRRSTASRTGWCAASSRASALPALRRVVPRARRRARGRATRWRSLGVERDAAGRLLRGGTDRCRRERRPARRSSRWPGGGRSPLAGAARARRAATPRAVAEAIVDAYRRRHALAFVEAPRRRGASAPPTGRGSTAAPAAGLPLVGPELDIPLGTLRAVLRVADGVIAAAAFRSEWLASSAGVAELERALVGAPLDAEALRARMAPVLADARALLPRLRRRGDAGARAPRGYAAYARKREVSGESASSAALSGWICLRALEQQRLVLGVVRIGHAAVDRADLGALLRLVEADALGAELAGRSRRSPRPR